MANKMPSQDEVTADLAYLIYLRWGRDWNAAHVAFCRLMQNNCSFSSYENLVLSSYLRASDYEA